MSEQSSTYAHKNTLRFKILWVSELKKIKATEENFRKFRGVNKTIKYEF